MDRYPVNTIFSDSMAASFIALIKQSYQIPSEGKSLFAGIGMGEVHLRNYFIRNRSRGLEISLIH